MLFCIAGNDFCESEIFLFHQSFLLSYTVSNFLIRDLGLLVLGGYKGIIFYKVTSCDVGWRQCQNASFWQSYFLDFTPFYCHKQVCCDGKRKSLSGMSCTCSVTYTNYIFYSLEPNSSNDKFWKFGKRRISR